MLAINLVLQSKNHKNFLLDNKLLKEISFLKSQNPLNNNYSNDFRNSGDGGEEDEDVEGSKHDFLQWFMLIQGRGRRKGRWESPLQGPV